MRVLEALALVVAAGVLFAFARYLAATFYKEPLIPMRVGDAVLSVEIANTPLKQIKGLSGRGRLAENEGMFFIFDRPASHQFWMKNMKFPIDIIWIGELKEGAAVVEVSRDVRPDSFPRRFAPSSSLRYVLEVNAGWAERHGVETGTPVILPGL